MSAGQQLDAIMKRMDAAYGDWKAAGYGYGTPAHDTLEAVYADLREWNKVNA